MTFILEKDFLKMKLSENELEIDSNTSPIAGCSETEPVKGGFTTFKRADLLSVKKLDICCKIHKSAAGITVQNIK